MAFRRLAEGIVVDQERAARIRGEEARKREEGWGHDDGEEDTEAQIRRLEEELAQEGGGDGGDGGDGEFGGESTEAKIRRLKEEIAQEERGRVRSAALDLARSGTRLKHQSLPHRDSFRGFRMRDAWLPARGDQGIAVLPTCDVEERFERWKQSFPTGMSDRSWGCSFNALAFLDVLTHESATRRMRELESFLESEQKTCPSLPPDTLGQWFNLHGADKGITYTLQQYPIHEKSDLQRFYDMLRHELPLNSCTIMVYNGHYNVVSRTSEDQLYVYEPMFGTRYPIIGRVSDRYWASQTPGKSAILVRATMSRKSGRRPFWKFFKRRV